MKYLCILLILISSTYESHAESKKLVPTIHKLTKQHPKNKRINFVFHGHSVVCGFTKQNIINSSFAYPQRFYVLLKHKYPYALINCITTAIPGENSEEGAARFSKDVLSMKPDCIMIDYALNDIKIGLDRAKKAHIYMIKEARKHKIPIILFTPNLELNATDTASLLLSQHANQIKELSSTYATGLVDTHSIFRIHKKNLAKLMASQSHPNSTGHQLIANELIKLFLK